MVVGLHAWVEKTLQPAAQEAFGSPVTRLRNASGYACRNARRQPVPCRPPERARAGQRHRHRRLRHRRRPRDRGGAPLGPDGARSARGGEDRGGGRQGCGTAGRQARARQDRARRKPEDQRHRARRRSPSQARRRAVKTAELQKPARARRTSVADPKAIPAPPAPGREDVPKARRHISCAGCTRAPAACSAPCWAPRPTRRTATISISTWRHRRTSSYCQ